MNYQRTGSIAPEPISSDLLGREQSDESERHATRIAQALGTLFHFCQYEHVATHAVIAHTASAQNGVGETRILHRLAARQAELPEPSAGYKVIRSPESNALDPARIGNPSTPHFEAGLLRFINTTEGPLHAALVKLEQGDIESAKQVALFARTLNQLGNELHAVSNGAIAIHDHVVTFHAAAKHVLNQNIETNGLFELTHHGINPREDTSMPYVEHIRRAHTDTHQKINEQNPHAHQIYTHHQRITAEHPIVSSIQTPTIEAALIHHLGLAEQMLIGRERDTLNTVITLPQSVRPAVPAAQPTIHITHPGGTVVTFGDATQRQASNG